MIHPKAINQFLRRPRDTHSWLKQIPEREIDAELANLKFKPASNTRPLNRHQKVCILLGLSYPAFAHWVDLGGGKTRIALELLNHWWKRKRFTGCLILTPSESAMISWENQIKEWGITIPYSILWNSSTAEKLDVLEEFEHGLLLCTYAGLPWLLSKMTAIKNPRGRKKQKLIPDPKRIKLMRSRIDALVLDEATKVLNHQSLCYRLCAQLRKGAFLVYELAGRPLGRDPIALWSQLKLIDGGATLGETLGLYRAAFFDEKQGYFGGTEYKFRKNMEPDLSRIIQHRSITYEGSEWNDVKAVHKLEEVLLPDEANAYYQRFLKQLRASHAGFIERKNTFIRMRQISSGFVGLLDDETGAKVEVEFASNPKLDRLMELVGEVPRGCKFVVFHDFIHSGTMICRALKEAHIKHGWLRGGVKNAREIQDRFDHDDAWPGLVVNSHLGAYALNLQRGNFVFVFEAPVGVLDDEQMRKRVPRTGQTRTVFEYDLVCRGTVDSRILAFHKEGKSLWAALKRDPELILSP